VFGASKAPTTGRPPGGASVCVAVTPRATRPALFVARDKPVVEAVVNQPDDFAFVPPAEGSVKAVSNQHVVIR
jgi:hypothetical protein